MLLKVGELAKRSGLTVRALHHYDSIGLLHPSGRSESGYRLYSRDDVARLHGIQTLRLSVSGENLFTITDYSGVDPELPAGTNDKGVLSVTSTGGTSVYPAVRKFMLGVN